MFCSPAICSPLLLSCARPCPYELGSGATYRRRDQMAVGLRHKFEGGTQQQYEAVHGKLRVEEDPPEGLIFHSAGPIEGGWGVIDYWESRAAFDRFAESRLMPAMQELGSDGPGGPPETKEFE